MVEKRVDLGPGLPGHLAVKDGQGPAPVQQIDSILHVSQILGLANLLPVNKKIVKQIANIIMWLLRCNTPYKSIIFLLRCSVNDSKHSNQILTSPDACPVVPVDRCHVHNKKILLLCAKQRRTIAKTSRKEEKFA